MSYANWTEVLDFRRVDNGENSRSQMPIMPKEKEESDVSTDGRPT